MQQLCCGTFEQGSECVHLCRKQVIKNNEVGGWGAGGHTCMSQHLQISTDAQRTEGMECMHTGFGLEHSCRQWFKQNTLNCLIIYKSLYNVHDSDSNIL